MAQNIYVPSVVTGQVASITVFTVVKVARDSLKELFAKICHMPAGKIETASLTKDREIDASTAGTKSVSRWE